MTCIVICVSAQTFYLPISIIERARRSFLLNKNIQQYCRYKKTQTNKCSHLLCGSIAEAARNGLLSFCFIYRTVR